MGELLKHAMNSLSRESPDFKKALNVLLKYEIYTLLQRLSDNGEESVVITASVSDGIKSHLGSSKGEGFIQNAHQLDSLKDQFLQYCWGKYDGNTSTRADKPVSTDTIVIKSEPKDTVDLVMTRVDSDPEDGIQQHSVTHTPNKQPRVSCSSPSSLRTQATGGQVNSSRVSPSVTSSSTSETGPCTVLMRSPSLGQNNVSTLHSPMTLPTRETSLGYRSNATQQSSLANLGQGSGRECRSRAAETVASIEAYEAQQLVSGSREKTAMARNRNTNGEKRINAGLPKSTLASHYGSDTLIDSRDPAPNPYSVNTQIDAAVVDDNDDDITETPTNQILPLRHTAGFPLDSMEFPSLEPLPVNLYVARSVKGTSHVTDTANIQGEYSKTKDRPEDFSVSKKGRELSVDLESSGQYLGTDENLVDLSIMKEEETNTGQSAERRMSFSASQRDGVGTAGNHDDQEVIEDTNSSFLCGRCGGVFESQHKRDVHEGLYCGAGRNSDGPYKCDMCSVEFTDEGLFHQHRYIVHVCSSRKHQRHDDSPTDLSVHKDDDNNRSSTSHFKSSRFNNNDNFPKSRNKPGHMKGHGVWSSQSTQSRHGYSVSGTSTLHTGADKPFICPHCSKGFNAKRYLQAHMDLHDTTTRHQCPFCSACYPQRNSLRKHITRKHPPTQEF